MLPDSSGASRLTPTTTAASTRRHSRLPEGSSCWASPIFLENASPLHILLTWVCLVCKPQQHIVASSNGRSICDATTDRAPSSIGSLTIGRQLLGRIMREFTTALLLTACMSSLSSANEGIIRDQGFSAATTHTVQISSSLDTNICDCVGRNMSDALSEGMFVGKNGHGFPRRGLLSFDLHDAQIPAGATILNVSVSLFCDRSASSSLVDVFLHRALEQWGIGTSNSSGGGCAPATANDTTWSHRVWPNIEWQTAGGTFVPQYSAYVQVGANMNFYTISSPQLTKDVAMIVSGTAPNYGWALVGDENSHYTTKRFVTRESYQVAWRPSMNVTYSMSR